MKIHPLMGGMVAAALAVTVAGGWLWTAQAADEPLVRAELLADVAAVEPGGAFTVGVVLRIEPGWHVYWANPGDSGMASELHVTAPEGFEVGPLQWPVPRKFTVDNATTYGYDGEVLLMVTIKSPATVQIGATLSIRADAAWLACDEAACVAGEAKGMTVAVAVGPRKPAHAEAFTAWRAQLPIEAADAEAARIVTGAVDRIAGGVRVPLADGIVRVEWYPMPGADQLVENVRVSFEQGVATVACTLTRLNDRASAVVPGLLVVEDGKGGRRGVTVALDTSNAKP